MKSQKSIICATWLLDEAGNQISRALLISSGKPQTGKHLNNLTEGLHLGLPELFELAEKRGKSAYEAAGKEFVEIRNEGNEREGKKKEKNEANGIGSR